VVGAQLLVVDVAGLVLPEPGQAKPDAIGRERTIDADAIELVEATAVGGRKVDGRAAAPLLQGGLAGVVLEDAAAGSFLAGGGACLVATGIEIVFGTSAAIGCFTGLLSSLTGSGLRSIDTVLSVLSVSVL
jgi:hypothetical protein